MTTSDHKLIAHTPGPWEYDAKKRNHSGYPIYIHGEDWERLAAVSGHLNGDEESFANARLIAAAPELLEAATEFLNKQTFDTDEALRMAIAKATGGQP